MIDQAEKDFFNQDEDNNSLGTPDNKDDVKQNQTIDFSIINRSFSSTDTGFDETQDENKQTKNNILEAKQQENERVNVTSNTKNNYNDEENQEQNKIESKFNEDESEFQGQLAQHSNDNIKKEEQMKSSQSQISCQSENQQMEQFNENMKQQQNQLDLYMIDSSFISCEIDQLYKSYFKFQPKINEIIKNLDQLIKVIPNKCEDQAMNESIKTFKEQYIDLLNQKQEFKFFQSKLKELISKINIIQPKLCNQMLTSIGSNNQKIELLKSTVTELDEAKQFSDNLLNQIDEAEQNLKKLNLTELSQNINNILNSIYDGNNDQQQKLNENIYEKQQIDEEYDSQQRQIKMSIIKQQVLTEQLKQQSENCQLKIETITKQLNLVKTNIQQYNNSITAEQNSNLQQTIQKQTDIKQQIASLILSKNKLDEKNLNNKIELQNILKQKLNNLQNVIEFKELSRYWVIMLDVSSSFKGEAYKSSCQAITSFLGFLQQQQSSDTFSIIQFNDKAKEVFLKQKITDCNLDNVEKKLTSLFEGGGTNFKLAFNQLYETSKKNNQEEFLHVIMISDGDGKLNFEEEINKIRTYHQQLVFFGLAYGDAIKQDLFKNITKKMNNIEDTFKKFGSQNIELYFECQEPSVIIAKFNQIFKISHISKGDVKQKKQILNNHLNEQLKIYEKNYQDERKFLEDRIEFLQEIENKNRMDESKDIKIDFYQEKLQQDTKLQSTLEQEINKLKDELNNINLEKQISANKIEDYKMDIKTSETTRNNLLQTINENISTYSKQLIEQSKQNSEFLKKYGFLQFDQYLKFKEKLDYPSKLQVLFREIYQDNRILIQRFLNYISIPEQQIEQSQKNLDDLKNHSGFISFIFKSYQEQDKSFNQLDQKKNIQRLLELVDEETQQFIKKYKLDEFYQEELIPKLDFEELVKIYDQDQGKIDEFIDKVLEDSLGTADTEYEISERDSFTKQQKAQEEDIKSLEGQIQNTNTKEEKNELTMRIKSERESLKQTQKQINDINKQIKAKEKDFLKTKKREYDLIRRIVKSLVSAIKQATFKITTQVKDTPIKICINTIGQTIQSLKAQQFKVLTVDN